MVTRDLDTHEQSSISRRTLPPTARAAVALPGATGIVRDLELGRLGADDAWLEVVASGICGTDVALFAQGVASPTVLGHHVVARVAAIGPVAADRRDLHVGDRVVMEEYLPCGNCSTCESGSYRLCTATDLWGGGRRVGMLPVDEAPGLTGGNAEYVFLPANGIVHRLPATLSDDLATWVLPYGNAIDWVTGAGQLRAGETVAVLGPGYHGLAVVAAAVWAGARRVVVTGLAHDSERLAMAEALGAVPVVVQAGSDATTVERQLGGRADLVVDTVGSDPSVIAPAIDLLGHGGRLVLTHPKAPANVIVDSRLLVRNCQQIAGVRGRSPDAIARAISSLDDGTSLLSRVPVETVDLDSTAHMLTLLAAGKGPASPHVVVRPT